MGNSDELRSFARITCCRELGVHRRTPGRNDARAVWRRCHTDRHDRGRHRLRAAAAHAARAKPLLDRPQQGEAIDRSRHPQARRPEPGARPRCSPRRRRRRAADQHRRPMAFARIARQASPRPHLLHDRGQSGWFDRSGLHRQLRDRFSFDDRWWLSDRARQPCLARVGHRVRVSGRVRRHGCRRQPTFHWHGCGASPRSLRCRLFHALAPGHVGRG